MPMKRRSSAPEQGGQTSAPIRRRLFGLDAKAVEDRLLELHAVLDQALAENAALMQRIQELEASNADLGRSKERLESFLDEARRLTGLFSGEIDRQRSRLLQEVEDRRRVIVEQAGREAALLLREAEEKARARIAAADAQLQRLTDAVQRADAGRMATISRIKALLISQVEFLEALETMDHETVHSGLMALYSSATPDARGITDVATIIERITQRKDAPE